MTDYDLDTELRREFDAIFVPYDALRAQNMIDRATQDVLAGSRTWARPLAAAAAVLVVAGGGAALAAHHSASHPPAGGTSPITATVPSPTPVCTHYSDPTRKPVPARAIPPCGPLDTSQAPTPACTTFADPTPLCGQTDTPDSPPSMTTSGSPASTRATPTMRPSVPVESATPTGDSPSSDPTQTPGPKVSVTTPGS